MNRLIYSFVFKQIIARKPIFCPLTPIFLKSFSTHKSVITITDNAWKKIENIISKHPSGMLFSAQGGGCNGFNYSLKTINDSELDKMKHSKIKPTIVEKNSAKVYIDPIAEMYLMGTTIDYVSEDYEKQIYENKFTFEPDKELATSCGCGVSFSPRI